MARLMVTVSFSWFTPIGEYAREQLRDRVTGDRQGNRDSWLLKIFYKRLVSLLANRSEYLTRSPVDNL